MTSGRSLRNDRGFSLIEVLIAIVVIATGLVLIVEGMTRSQEAIGIANNLVVAGRLAEEKLTELEMQVLQGDILRSSSEGGTERVNGRSFSWTQQVRVYQDPLIEDQTKMNQAEAHVQWKEGAFRQNKFTLATLLLNPEKKG